MSVNCGSYCFTTGLTNYEFINQVEIGSLDNISGNNYGYGDFTNMNLRASAKRRYCTQALTPGFAGGSYSEAWRIWIDINQDQDFDDAGELVFSGGPSAAAVSGTMNIPSSAASPVNKDAGSICGISAPPTTVVLSLVKLYG
ncbi:MAG: GEVED domain-containing protein [Saprospiraceae bacterium]